MPNQDALTLAKVAIEAAEGCDLTVEIEGDITSDKLRQAEKDKLIDVAAAAIARHMERSKTFFEHISPDTLAPLYRITQEPRGGEDGD